ncbi:hypothetical protein GCM10007939_24110 [Amylibacter marinus]|uniref:DUF4169 family protein n=1 Tax=Amylibacter marinus TaxID=1475483 RepID=A0ABQ5VXY7_9RHOB|nr:hypothetical protein [Amylibacter marinus]GLQ36127.1 hypothetical protein GCM10007939_24110 [Amylibacter marinus]
MTNDIDKTNKPKSTAKIKAEAREARLKQQLRQNLHRRKAQARAKNDTE